MFIYNNNNKKNLRSKYKHMTKQALGVPMCLFSVELQYLHVQKNTMWLVFSWQVARSLLITRAAAGAYMYTHADPRVLWNMYLCTWHYMHAFILETDVKVISFSREQNLNGDVGLFQQMTSDKFFNHLFYIKLQ